MFKKNINKYSLDFLSKDIDNKILVPLKIIDDAIIDKKRQYTRDILVLLHDLQIQIGSSDVTTITKHPNAKLIS